MVAIASPRQSEWKVETSVVRFPTRVTLRFVLDQLPPASAGAARVLDVGRGDGALAAALRSAGLDAHAARWSDGPGTDDAGARRFDAVLFSHTLRRIHPLDDALDRARDLLAPGGVILVEDSSFDDVDRATAAWFFRLLTALRDAGMLSCPPGELGTRLLEGGGALGEWRCDPEHGSTPLSRISAALASRFDLLVERAEPDLYRQASAMLCADGAGETIAARIHEMERRMAEDGLVRLIGRRFVARLRRRDELARRATTPSRQDVVRVEPRGVRSSATAAAYSSPASKRKSATAGD